MQLDAFVVNAFTANAKGGNPAGVVFGADNLTDSQSLAIAKGLGFSETAFVSNSKNSTHKLRFFTTTKEVDLCGHATIATWSLLNKQGIHTAGAYSQDTLAGKLGIEIGNDGLVFMQQTKPKFYEFVDKNEIATVLNIEVVDFDDRLQPQIVSTGLRDVLVALKDEATLARMVPNFEAMSVLS